MCASSFYSSWDLDIHTDRDTKKYEGIFPCPFSGSTFYSTYFCKMEYVDSIFSFSR